MLAPDGAKQGARKKRLAIGRLLGRTPALSPRSRDVEKSNWKKTWWSPMGSSKETEKRGWQSKGPFEGPRPYCLGPVMWKMHFLKKQC